MKIIKFRESHIDTVFEIQRATYKPLYEKYQDEQTNPYMESKETVLQKYTRTGTIGYVFVKENVIVGTVRITLHPKIKMGRISALAVHPQYQGQGIAQQALLEIENINSDIQKWFLETIMQELGNCHLYEKIGYKKTGKTEVINENMTLVDYEKIKY